MYRNILLVLFAVFVISCQSKQEARRPVAYASGSFIKQSAERNKLIFEDQEAKFKALIKQNPNTKFIASRYGFYYSYSKKDTLKTALPVNGDFVYFDYEVRNIKLKTIYPVDKFKNRQYQVEKENIMSGLREGLKLLREGDIATFYFQSQFAYGYHGDNDKIHPNTPLIIKVTVNKIVRKAFLDAEKAKKDSIAAVLLAIEQSKPIETVTAVVATPTVNAPAAINTSTNTKPNPTVVNTTITTTKPTTTETVVSTTKPEVVIPPKPKPRKKLKPIVSPIIQIEEAKETVQGVKVLDQNLILKKNK